MDALIFCQDEAALDSLASALTGIGFEAETWREPSTLTARAIQARPALLVLFAAEGSRWIGAVIAAVHQASAGTKIIYATKNPGKEDAEALEQGVFYYAGNAPIEEIVASARAAFPQPAPKRADERPFEEENRFQLRLRPGETLGELFSFLIRRISQELEKVPGWAGLGPIEAAALDKELRATADHFVAAYDICGLKMSCFELADPAGWNGASDSAVAEPHAWEDVRILQLELKRGLTQFSDALEAAALRALCRGAARARTAKEARKALNKAAREVLGPRLFRSLHGECDMCKVVKHIDPWSIGVR